MIPNINELSQYYRDPYPETKVNHSYRWPIRFSNESQSHIEILDFYGNDGPIYKKLPFYEGKFPVSGRCEIRVSTERFGNNLEDFKTFTRNIVYQLHESTIEAIYVQNHPLIRALLKDNNPNYNEKIYVDESERKYVFNFPLLFDCFVKGNCLIMSSSQESALGILSSTELFLNDVSGKIYIEYCNGEFICNGPTFVKRLRCYETQGYSFELESYHQVNINTLQYHSSGLYVSFLDPSTCKTIYEYDFVENITISFNFNNIVGFDSDKIFKYTFSNRKIHGVCNKFSPRIWPNFLIEKESSSQMSNLSETRFPVEIWINVIKYVSCFTDAINLMSTCKKLYRLRKSNLVTSNIIRLPGWYCIPFNNDDEYDENQKGATVSLHNVNFITIAISFSNTSKMFQKYKGKRICVKVVNSFTDLAVYENGVIEVGFTDFYDDVRFL